MRERLHANPATRSTARLVAEALGAREVRRVARVGPPGGRAVLEYDLGGMGAGTLSFLGNKAKPLLGPLALRATPLTAHNVRVLLVAFRVVIVGAGVAAVVRRRKRGKPVSLLDEGDPIGRKPDGWHFVSSFQEVNTMDRCMGGGIMGVIIGP